MSSMKPYKFEVLPTSQARTDLSTTVDQFRTDGLLSSPVLFGSHRKAEAVIIPIELFEELLPAIEDIQLNETLRRRINDGTPRISFEDLVEKVGFKLEDVE
jgi:antitoxin StbD